MKYIILIYKATVVVHTEIDHGSPPYNRHCIDHLFLGHYFLDSLMAREFVIFSDLKCIVLFKQYLNSSTEFVPVYFDPRRYTIFRVFHF